MLRHPVRTGRRGGRLNFNRRPVLEALEVRALLTASPSAPWLIQLDSPTTPLPLAVAPDLGLSLKATGVPGLIQASGDPTSVASFAAQLAKMPGVRYVELEHTVKIQQDANDPSYLDGTLWGLNGPNGIQAPKAWDVTTGSTAVTIADIDTGIDYNHPDLYLNVWINQKEIPLSRMTNLTDVDGDGRITFYDLNNSINQGPGKITDVNGDGRIDGADLLAPMIKDGNGNDTGAGGWGDPNNVQDGDTAHPNDIVGWNFVNNTNNPFDDNGHGTHTAGILGAIGNNGIGVTGVAWKTQIMPLKFLSSNGSGSDTGAAAAIRYAADHGARVSNNSYGDTANSFTISAAIQYASAAGQIFVAAAGNSGTNNDVTPFYPANNPSPNVLSVAATEPDGTRASFSNYGLTTVHLGAPGDSNFSTGINGTYNAGAGTSYAAPYVTGTVALVMAAHPDWTASQVRARILATVTPVASLAGKTVSGGIVNAAAAVGIPAGTATATYVTTDTTTLGTWRGAYGSQGYAIPGNATSFNGLTLTGQASYVWTYPGDPNAAQMAPPAQTGARIASAWYSYNSFTADVNISDGQTHRLAAYFDDWDRGGRQETVQVLDASSGAVLDTRSMSNFASGQYLVWNVSGHVQVRVTNNNPNSNAVITALFLDPKV
jgi:subtilisin family serine protease